MRGEPEKPQHNAPGQTDLLFLVEGLIPPTCLCLTRWCSYLALGRRSGGEGLTLTFMERCQLEKLLSDVERLAPRLQGSLSPAA